MSMMRESFFDCAWVSDGQKRTAQVRAWTASGARRVFLDMLAAEGIQDPGRVSVTEVRYQQAPVGFAVARAGHGSRP